MSCASACVGILWQSRDLGPNFVSCLQFSCKISPSCFFKLFTACFVAHFCFKFGDSLLTFTCESACNRRIQAFLTTPRVSAAYLLCPQLSDSGFRAAQGPNSGRNVSQTGGIKGPKGNWKVSSAVRMRDSWERRSCSPCKETSEQIRALLLTF